MIETICIRVAPENEEKALAERLPFGWKIISRQEILLERDDEGADEEMPALAEGATVDYGKYVRTHYISILMKREILGTKPNDEKLRLEAEYQHVSDERQNLQLKRDERYGTTSLLKILPLFLIGLTLLVASLGPLCYGAISYTGLPASSTSNTPMQPSPETLVVGGMLLIAGLVLLIVYASRKKALLEQREKMVDEIKKYDDDLKRFDEKLDDIKKQAEMIPEEKPIVVIDSGDQNVKTDKLAKLDSLFKMLQSGAITQEEFEKLKKEII